MKRNRSYRRKQTGAGPSAFAWVVLTLAWLCTVPLAAFVFWPRAPKASEPETAEAFSPTEPEQEIPTVSASLQFYPALNALRREEPTVLIYHTHTTEAYTQTETDVYTETSKWRTSDPTQNVIAVGEALKEILETQYGFSVIHDTTDHEPPKLATAYDRSLVTLERYHREYPSIVLFIDLHRDAYETDNAPCDYLTINGTETARLMFCMR